MTDLQSQNYSAQEGISVGIALYLPLISAKYAFCLQKRGFRRGRLKAVDIFVINHLLFFRLTPNH